MTGRTRIQQSFDETKNILVASLKADGKCSYYSDPQFPDKAGPFEGFEEGIYHLRQMVDKRIDEKKARQYSRKSLVNQSWHGCE